jgi:hypothetical protein
MNFNLKSYWFLAMIKLILIIINKNNSIKIKIY